MKDLFGLELAPPARRPPRPGWERVDSATTKTWATYLHKRSGWMVRHCGHPTANWPYFAIKPGDSRTVVTHNGKGFHTIQAAFDAVEAVLQGTLVVTDSRCGARTLRVTTKEDDHE